MHKNYRHIWKREKRPVKKSTHGHKSTKTYVGQQINLKSEKLMNIV